MVHGLPVATDGRNLIAIEAVFINQGVHAIADKLADECIYFSKPLPIDGCVARKGFDICLQFSGQRILFTGDEFKSRIKLNYRNIQAIDAGACHYPDKKGH